MKKGDLYVLFWLVDQQIPEGEWRKNLSVLDLDVQLTIKDYCLKRTQVILCYFP